MRIVIDSNRIIAALLRDSTSRRVLFDNRFLFFAPEKSKEEIFRHRKELETKAKLKPEEFEFILEALFEQITVKSKSNYFSKLDEASELISDADDAPFLALAIAINADAIWSDDKGFLQQIKIRILRTEDIITI